MSACFNSVKGEESFVRQTRKSSQDYSYKLEESMWRTGFREGNYPEALLGFSCHGLSNDLRQNQDKS